MRAEICMSLKSELLQNPIFSRWSKINPSCVASIVLRLKVQIYLPGDVIFYKGSVGREMYARFDASFESVEKGGSRDYETSIF
jgi:hypothetical protein